MRAGNDRLRGEMIALLPRLRRFARALCRSADEADDLVQTACERGLRGADGWQEGTRLDSWMFRILQNVWIDQCRAARSRPSGFEVVDPEAHGHDTPAREVESRLLLAAVRRAARQLPEELQSVLLLVCLEEFSYRETAETLGIPIGTVMSRLARARTTLIRVLEIEPDRQATRRRSGGQAL